MPHSPLNDGTENNRWEMRRSHVGAYEKRCTAWKKFTHVSEARTASTVGMEYVRKCMHNVTIRTCPFLNFLVIQAINFFFFL